MFIQNILTCSCHPNSHTMRRMPGMRSQGQKDEFTAVGLPVSKGTGRPENAPEGPH